MLRVRTLWTGVAGSPYYTNLYFEGTISTDAEAAVAAVRAMWNTIRAGIDNRLTITVEGFVASVDPASGALVGGFSVAPPAPVTGTAAAPLPSLVQGLVQLRTGEYIAGRAVRGRVFLPGMVEEQNGIDGRPVPALRTLVDGAVDALIAAAPVWVVYSPKNGQTADVIAADMASEWSYLGSRKAV